MNGKCGVLPKLFKLPFLLCLLPSHFLKLLFPLFFLLSQFLGLPCAILHLLLKLLELLSDLRPLQKSLQKCLIVILKVLIADRGALFCQRDHERNSPILLVLEFLDLYPEALRTILCLNCSLDIRERHTTWR